MTLVIPRYALVIVTDCDHTLHHLVSILLMLCNSVAGYTGILCCGERHIHLLFPITKPDTLFPHQLCAGVYSALCCLSKCKMSKKTGLPRSLKILEVLELAKENSRPWKVLEFWLQSLKILGWGKFLTFNCKK